jgi:LCCL domain-containing protein
MIRTLRSTSCLYLLAIFLLVGQSLGDDGPKKSTNTVETIIQVQLADDSVLKLALLDPVIELQTPHGKLSIPVGEIRKIDIGMRISDELAGAIRGAIADLGSDQQQKREAAVSLLLKWKEKAYPALKQAAKSGESEMAKKAAELAEKLEETVPEAQLALPEYDVIQTEKSKIAGKIASPTLNTRSFAFGDLTLKLADVRAMSSSGFKAETPVAAGLPDPGSLTAYRQPQNIGKTYTFRVTGAANGSLWGTGTYTLDSTLAAAAVHAGILKVGETGNVTVTIFGPSMNFVGTTQNGLTSSNYDSYPGAYQIHPKRR